VSALGDIRTALATALAGAPGLNTYEVVPGQINTPAAVVAPEGIEYLTDFDGGATYRLPVQFLASLGDWGTAQRQLDTYIAHDGTAVAAIHAAEGIEVRVVSMESYGLTTFSDTSYLGAQVIVEVIV
jgi:hypothetical protein